MSEKRIVVTQTRSSIRRYGRQLKTLKCLGLGRIGKSAQHNMNESTVGMIRKVAHLVEVRELDSKKG